MWSSNFATYLRLTVYWYERTDKQADVINYGGIRHIRRLCTMLHGSNRAATWSQPRNYSRNVYIHYRSYVFLVSVFPGVLCASISYGE